MALQTSGQISLNDIHVEAGGSSGSLVGINDADVRGLISKSSGAQMAFNEWYGASSQAFDPASQSFPSGTNTITGSNATYYEMVATTKAGLSFTLTNVSAGGEIWVAMVGGGGGRWPSNFGLDFRRGAGGVGMCKITVPNGVSTLTVKVGGAGYINTSAIAPFGVEPGGGDGGAGSYAGQDLGYNASATGGGYSGIFSGTSITQSNALAIVGGGGGVSSQPYYGQRAHGGGLNQNGHDPIPTGGSFILSQNCGRGATLSAGGAGGPDTATYYGAGSAGYALHGGTGGSSKYDGGSGGGGGYYGGGGGAGGGGYSGASGGGGSGYANTSHCSNISNGSPYDGNESSSAAASHYRSQLQSLINTALGDSITLTKDHGGYYGGFVIALPN